jgi:hypothetical protein
MRDFIGFVFRFVALAGIVFVVFTLGGALGMRFGRESTQRQAVERGAGRWIIDEPTGEKSFAWTAEESRE